MSDHWNWYCRLIDHSSRPAVRSVLFKKLRPQPGFVYSSIVGHLRAGGKSVEFDVIPRLLCVWLRIEARWTFSNELLFIVGGEGGFDDFFFGRSLLGGNLILWDQLGNNGGIWVFSANLINYYFKKLIQCYMILK